MPFTWSEHALHIQTLFRPWQAGDGYREEVLRTAEASLDIRLPTVLRLFYRSWGTREDLTRRCDTLLVPSELFLRAGALVFCSENQSVLYWAILRTSLGLDDPPIHVAEVAWDQASDEPGLGSWRLSHERLSSFLDALSYAHAFAGGAVHGGRSRERLDDRRFALLEQHWKRVDIQSARWSLLPDDFTPRSWPLYVRDGQVIDAFGRLSAAVRRLDDLDEISQILDITWKGKW